MRLELPFDALLPKDTAVLIAGMSGGFDVFCGLPIYFELRQRGYTAHLASLSFAAIQDYTEGEWLSDTLVGVGANIPHSAGYHPEHFLAHWFRKRRKEDVTAGVLITPGRCRLRRIIAVWWSG